MSNEAQSATNMAYEILLRIPAVKAGTGLSRSSIYNRIDQGLMPRPVSLGGRSVGWPENEISAVNAARIAGKSDEEIRSLVSKLEARRGSSAGVHRTGGV